MKYQNSGDAAVAELRSIRNYLTRLTVMVFLALCPVGVIVALFLAGIGALPWMVE